jgi:hypothetical protein
VAKLKAAGDRKRASRLVAVLVNRHVASLELIMYLQWAPSPDEIEREGLRFACLLVGLQKRQ